MEWQATDNSKSLVPVFWGLIRTAPGDQDKNAIRVATTELNKSFGLLNDHLEGKQYVAGNSFSIGDIPAGAAAYRFYSLPIERDSFPHLETWYQILKKRTAFRELVMVPLS